MDGDTGAAILSDTIGTGGLDRNTLAPGFRTITILGTGSRPADPGASPTLVHIGSRRVG